MFHVRRYHVHTFVLRIIHSLLHQNYKFYICRILSMWGGRWVKLWKRHPPSKRVVFVCFKLFGLGAKTVWKLRNPVQEFWFLWLMVKLCGLARDVHGFCFLPFASFVRPWNLFKQRFSIWCRYRFITNCFVLVLAAPQTSQSKPFARMSGPLFLLHSVH